MYKETGEEKKLSQEEYSDILYTAANIMIRDHGIQWIDLPPQESGPQHQGQTIPKKTGHFYNMALR